MFYHIFYIYYTSYCIGRFYVLAHFYFNQRKNERCETNLYSIVMLPEENRYIFFYSNPSTSDCGLYQAVL